MKWLKLFENFQLDDYDNKMDLEDAKWIVITHLGEINELELPYEYTSIENVLYLEVANPTSENIKKCESHLSAEGFFIFVNDDKCLVGFGDKTSFILNWLTTNFGKHKLKTIKAESTFGKSLKITYVQYCDENGNQVLSHTIKSKEIIIGDIIWEFFLELLRMKINEIEPILNSWLEKEWGLLGCRAFF
jgi:hypothetical protein